MTRREALQVLLATAGSHDVRRYGAKGDGSTKDTAALQNAINAAAKAGGGTVSLPAGRYLSGTLHLKSGVSIWLGPGATLAASPDESDFDRYEKLPYAVRADRETSFFRYALLAGEGVKDVAIEGQGTIDGNRAKRGGPKPVALKRCEHVSIRGITIRNAPNYAISMLGCDRVLIDGVTILNAFSDGIDPDCSRFVQIANCFVESIDDSICLKASDALGERRATEHVTVTNCLLRTASIHFKMGTESFGDFRNVAISNCSMIGGYGFRHGNPGLAFESVDGGRIQGLVVSNIVMRDVGTPIFLRLGRRHGEPGAVEDVSIRGVVATGAKATSAIAGIPGHRIRRVDIENVRISVQGGQSAPRATEVPEMEAAYPDPTMFGILPAYGLYCRHAEDLTLRNMWLEARQPDARPALVFDDVVGLVSDGIVERRPEAGFVR